MKNIIEEEEVGFVRPDALREELTIVKVIGEPKKEKIQKVDVIKVVNLEEKQEDTVCHCHYTQFVNNPFLIHFLLVLLSHTIFLYHEHNVQHNHQYLIYLCHEFLYLV